MLLSDPPDARQPRMSGREAREVPILCLEFQRTARARCAYQRAICMYMLEGLQTNAYVQ